MRPSNNADVLSRFIFFCLCLLPFFSSVPPRVLVCPTVFSSECSGVYGHEGERSPPVVALESALRSYRRHLRKGIFREFSGNFPPNKVPPISISLRMLLLVVLSIRYLGVLGTPRVFFIMSWEYFLYPGTARQKQRNTSTLITLLLLYNTCACIHFFCLSLASPVFTSSLAEVGAHRQAGSVPLRMAFKLPSADTSSLLPLDIVKSVSASFQ